MILYDPSEVYEGFSFPWELQYISKLGLEDFYLWFLMDADLGSHYIRDMAKRYPQRHLIPFAKRGDCDDVACFELEKPGKVMIIHDFASPGWEQREEYDTFWDWFRAAVNLMIDCADEDVVVQLSEEESAE